MALTAIRAWVLPSPNSTTFTPRSNKLEYLKEKSSSVVKCKTYAARDRTNGVENGPGRVNAENRAPPALCDVQHYDVVFLIRLLEYIHEFGIIRRNVASSVALKDHA